MSQSYQLEVGGMAVVTNRSGEQKKTPVKIKPIRVWGKQNNSVRLCGSMWFVSELAKAWPYFIFRVPMDGNALMAVEELEHHFLGWAYLKVEVLAGAWDRIPVDALRIFEYFLYRTEAVFLFDTRAPTSVFTWKFAQNLSVSATDTKSDVAAGTLQSLLYNESQHTCPLASKSSGPMWTSFSLMALYFQSLLGAQQCSPFGKGYTCLYGNHPWNRWREYRPLQSWIS